jgi:hypothetical protein
VTVVLFCFCFEIVFIASSARLRFQKRRISTERSPTTEPANVMDRSIPSPPIFHVFALILEMIFLTTMFSIMIMFSQNIKFVKLPTRIHHKNLTTMLCINILPPFRKIRHIIFFQKSKDVNV